MTQQLIVIRIRGTNKTIADIEMTLAQLRLHRVNHAVILEDRSSYLGMLQRAKDYLAWGPINKESLVALLTKRGRTHGLGEKTPRTLRLSDKFVKDNTPYTSIEGLADAVITGKVKLTDLPAIKPVFRLHPPKGGFKGSVKRPKSVEGVAGNHGEKIGELLKIMI